MRFSSLRGSPMMACWGQCRPGADAADRLGMFRGHTEQRSAGGDSDLPSDLVGFVQLRRGRWAPPVSLCDSQAGDRLCSISSGSSCPSGIPLLGSNVTSWSINWPR